MIEIVQRIEPENFWANDRSRYPWDLLWIRRDEDVIAVEARPDLEGLVTGPLWCADHKDGPVCIRKVGLDAFEDVTAQVRTVLLSRLEQARRAGRLRKDDQRLTRVQTEQMEPQDWQARNGELGVELRAIWNEQGRMTGAEHCLVNRSPTPLDRYHKRRQLAHDDVENERRYVAGDRLRRDWHNSGMEPRMVANLQGNGGGSGDPSSATPATEKAAMARQAFRNALQAVGIRLCPVLIQVVCCEQTASDWAHSIGHRGETECRLVGMTTLRIALDTLADHYRLT